MGILDDLVKSGKEVLKSPLNTIFSPINYALENITETGFSSGARAVPILGNIIGRQEAKSEAEQANARNEANFQKNVDLQKEFAKNGLSWKIEDGRKNGISPLASIGAQSANSFQPMSQSTEGTSQDNSLLAAGQDIGRYLLQLQLETARNENYGTDLDNELKVAQIGKLKADTAKLGVTTPPVSPQKYSDAPSQFISWFPQPKGRVMAMPSQAATEALENDLPASLTFQQRRALGEFDPNDKKSGHPLPKGFHYWKRAGPFEWEPAMRPKDEGRSKEYYDNKALYQKWGF